MQQQPSFTVYSITDCGNLSNPSFGIVSLTGTSFEHVANYSCNAGYQLIGSPTRICLSGASWSGSGPTCEPIGKTKCVVDCSSTRLNALLMFPLFPEIRKPISKVLVAKEPRFLHADSKDSDQTGRAWFCHVAAQVFTRLQFNSSQCALDVSIKSEKFGIQFQNFSSGNTFQKCNPPDFKLYPNKLTNKTFPHMV